MHVWVTASLYMASKRPIVRKAKEQIAFPVKLPHDIWNCMLVYELAHPCKDTKRQEPYTGGIHAISKKLPDDSNFTELCIKGPIDIEWLVQVMVDDEYEKVHHRN